MNISAHEANNMYYLFGTSVANADWALGFTSQQLVTPAIVTETGGTYE
jgi:hypothetical protein